MPHLMSCVCVLTLLHAALASKSFVPLQPAGLGRYGASPALFLEKERGGKVLPVPLPRECVLACEQALSPRTPAMAEVRRSRGGKAQGLDRRRQLREAASVVVVVVGVGDARLYSRVLSGPG